MLLCGWVFFYAGLFTAFLLVSGLHVCVILFFVGSEPTVVEVKSISYMYNSRYADMVTPKTLRIRLLGVKDFIYFLHVAPFSREAWFIRGSPVQSLP